MMRQLLLRSVIPCAILLLGGCLPYAFPSLVLTPPVNVADVADEVHVFRVDVNTNLGPPCYGYEWFSLRPVSLMAGVVPPQVQAGLDRGIFIIGVALNYHFHYHEGCHVRIYRPGYELVEFRSWQLGKRLHWTPVTDLAGRERAIDRLVGAPETTRNLCAKPTPEGGWALPGGLRTGSYSHEHEDFLRFVVQEYERLAHTNDISTTEDDRQRLLHKAAAVWERIGRGK